eukprot:CAMPEP_0181108328 /NCGR_PEP_ID=MMETSP1071-20121207/17572_1 /TAXON_ID=35127 /ORGANISM="Thalassiosira sp., Strain NH16" /LENGTH=34 /DNA_ID= /DNA_START= /DNA_END= /DNA_ORIENTATION=
MAISANVSGEILGTSEESMTFKPLQEMEVDGYEI